jgi:hypothetical protein
MTAPGSRLSPAVAQEAAAHPRLIEIHTCLRHSEGAVASAQGSGQDTGPDSIKVTDLIDGWSRAFTSTATLTAQIDHSRAATSLAATGTQPPTARSTGSALRPACNDRASPPVVGRNRVFRPDRVFDWRDIIRLGPPRPASYPSGNCDDRVSRARPRRSPGRSRRACGRLPGSSY